MCNMFDSFYMFTVCYHDPQQGKNNLSCIRVIHGNSKISFKMLKKQSSLIHFLKKRDKKFAGIIETFKLMIS